MTVFDRYVIWSFIKIFLICFISLTGLYIVIDVFGNLEEFLGYAKQQGSLLAVLSDYYTARVFAFFDQMAGILMLVSAAFTVTFLKQQNEMTALMAAGVSKRRIAMPVLGVVLVVSLLASINRETLLPAHREKLLRNAQNWLGDQARSVRPTYDRKTELLIRAESCYGNERRLETASFRFPIAAGDFGDMVEAERAYYVQADEHGPGGYLLTGVTRPADPKVCPSFYFEEQPWVFSPCDQSWLKPDQLFVVTDVDFEQLAAGNDRQRFASTWELIKGLHNESLDWGLGTNVTVHARLIQPLLDLTLVLLGLSFILADNSRNVFVAGGLSALIGGALFVVTLGSHSMGNSSLFSPAFAAWCPLMIFAPIAAFVSRPFWE